MRSYTQYTTKITKENPHATDDHQYDQPSELVRLLESNTQYTTRNLLLGTKYMFVVTRNQQI